jgi:hypothetical protein
VISGLHAARLLLQHGFVQEQGVLHRTLDDLDEDILFLAAAITNGNVTDLHHRYLRAFYEEEFDKPNDPVASTQKRDMVPRARIRAYLASVFDTRGNPSRNIAVTRTLSKAYSGFVHGASPHVMDMYGGNPPVFHLRGMLGTPRIEEHASDAWNYFYRGLISTIAVAMAFGDKPLVDYLRAYKQRFESMSGGFYNA